MFTVVSTLIDLVLEILFGVAKKLIGWAFFTVLIIASIVTTIVIVFANILT